MSMAIMFYAEYNLPMILASLNCLIVNNFNIERKQFFEKRH